jgi:hypothetical protein
MKLCRCSAARAPVSRRGVALLMAFLVLMVVLAICAQLRMSTGSAQRTAINDMGITRMEQAIESSLLEVCDQLKQDSEAGGESAGAGGAGAPGGVPGAPGGAAGGAPGAAPGGGQEEPVDSHEDTWGKPQRTAINQVELRVIVQDEDSKVNVLGMLTPNEDEAEKVFQRVVRILDTCRQGTTEDIDSSDAERMAIVMRDHLRKRSNSVAPRTKLLSDTEEDPDTGLPLTLKEFASIEPFEPQHFRDYRDDRGKIVHSVGAFLTVHTTLRTGDSLLPANSTVGGSRGGATSPGGNTPSNPGGGGNANSGGSNPGSGSPGSSGAPNNQGGQNGQTGQGNQGGQGAGGGSTGGTASGSASGIAVNVNTAPPCVLKALMDDRDIGGRWWDAVIEYRNLEEKEEGEEAAEEAEPVYDEYGREVIQRQVFDNVAELEQVPGTERLEGNAKAEVLRLLTTQSQVFSIYVTARILNQNDAGGRNYDGPPRPGEHDDELGNALTRSVRAVVWRVTSDDGTTLVPLVRWEVLDYMPFEVLDYPDEDR